MLKIKWWNLLEWVVKVSGSKNASLPILWASLLLKWKVTLRNVPKIGDVFTFLELLEGIGVTYRFESWDDGINVLHLDSFWISSSRLDGDKVKKIRSSIFLLFPLLHFFWKVEIPFPGWCSIGKRSIDSHLKWWELIWYFVSETDDVVSLEWKLESWERVLNAGFWVGVTENFLIANVLRWGKTIIHSAATEPHVMNLVSFLRQAGAQIFIRYNHTIVIEWVSELKSDFEFDIIADYIESGTYMIIGALTAKEYITIENARVEDLYVFIEKLKEAWVKIEDIWNDSVRVYKAEKLEGISIQTNIFPGFPTDLQSPFSVLMTQAEGMSKIHEVLFESRLNFLVELEKMKAKLALLNPHEALIFGDSSLKGTQVTSWDLRAGAAMVIAWLIAEGETQVTNVEYIYRGYENFVSKLQALWADIEEVR